MKIHVILENTAAPGHEDLKVEHGLCLLIEHNDVRLLFDTGATDASLDNAKKLHLAPDHLTGICLSHNHWDHTGGLRTWLKAYPDSTLWAHPGIFTAHYNKEKFVGAPMDEQEIKSLARFVPVNGPTELVPGIYATGAIPRRTEFEDTGGAFYLDRPDSARLDPIEDDQGMVVDQPDGLVVITGCAHSGIINILMAVEDHFPGRPIKAVVGGFHLLNSGPERLKATIEQLRSRNPQKLAAGHCTGDKPIDLLKAEFGQAFTRLGAGLTLEI